MAAAPTSTTSDQVQAHDDEPRTLRLERLIDRATAREQEANPVEALAVLEEAPADLRDLSTFFYSRGALLVRAGRPEEAIADLEEAVRLEPDVPEMKSNLGGALISLAQQKAGGPEGLGQPEVVELVERALEVLDDAARSSPVLPDVHCNHGRALHLHGRAHQALMAYERALAVDGHHVPTLYNKAAAQAATGDERGSLTTLERLLSIEPEHAPALESSARLRAKLG